MIHHFYLKTRPIEVCLFFVFTFACFTFSNDRLASCNACSEAFASFRGVKILMLCLCRAATRCCGHKSKLNRKKDFFGVERDSILPANGTNAPNTPPRNTHKHTCQCQVNAPGDGFTVPFWGECCILLPKKVGEAA